MFRPAIVVVLSAFCALSVDAAASTMAISKDVNEMKYFYIPSSNQRVEIAYNNRNSLEASNLKAAAKTYIIVDGFLSDSTSPMSTLLSASYSSKLASSNVIVVDWGRLSGSGLTLGNPLATASAYMSAIGNVPPVGARLAEFINFLRTNKNIQFSDVTIIGHSLGSHIAASAGRTVISNYNSRIARICGLDPAGSFVGMQVAKDKRLAKGCATFVDIYHTNRGTLGDADNDTADVNVYINGGKQQPGCEEADSAGFAGYCSHSYSWKYFNEAFGNLRGCACSGDSACTCATCNYQCSSSVVVGPNISTSTRGRIHVSAGAIA